MRFIIKQHDRFVVVFKHNVNLYDIIYQEFTLFFYDLYYFSCVCTQFPCGIFCFDWKSVEHKESILCLFLFYCKHMDIVQLFDLLYI